MNQCNGIKHDIPVPPTEGISETAARSMVAYVQSNFNKSEIDPVPKEWEQWQYQIYLNAVVEELYGEDDGIRWLQGRVFAHLGSKNDDFSLPEGNSCQIPNDPQLKSGKIIDAFMDGNHDFLKDQINECYQKFNYTGPIKVDDQSITDVVIESIYYALGEPTGRRMDQRINFFLFHSHHLTDDAKRVLKDLNISFSDNESNDDDLIEWRESGGKHGCIYFNDTRNVRVRRIVIDRLSSIADGPGGLFQVLEFLAAKKNTDVQSHVKYVITSRMHNFLSNEAKERNRVKGDQVGTVPFMDSINSEDESDFSSVMVGYVARPMTSDEMDHCGVDENDTSFRKWHHLDKRHVSSREDTYEQKTQMAGTIRRFALEQVAEIQSVADAIISPLRKESERMVEELLKGNKRPTPSERLDLILPDTLSLYLQVLYDEIVRVATAEQAVSDQKLKSTRFEFMWRDGRTKISAGNGQLELSVSTTAISDGLKGFVETKMKDVSVYYGMFEKGFKSIADISSETGIPIETVRAVINGMQVWDKWDIKQSRGGSSSNFVDYFSNMSATELKSYFAHRWTKMLPYLYYKVDESRKYDKETNPRVFEQFSNKAVSALLDLLAVHTYIREGTIPRMVEYELVTVDMLSASERSAAERDGRVKISRGKRYLIDDQGNEVMQDRIPPAVGKAWGWNVNRQTRCANTETYWIIMGQPMIESGDVPVVELPERVEKNRTRIKKLKQLVNKR